MSLINMSRKIVVFFPILINELSWEVIVRFVNIVGIVDHRCLNFLFYSVFPRILFFFFFIYYPVFDKYVKKQLSWLFSLF